MAREDEIRLIAYTIWEEEGCPSDRDCEHWYRAEIIWEQRQKPAPIVETKTEPAHPVKNIHAKTAAAQKTTRKTSKK